MLVDTTVFIDLLRQEKKAKEYLLEVKEPLTISKVIQMELISGSRSKKEVEVINRLLEDLKVEIVEINERISQKAGEFFEKYFPQKGMGALDAFIAATAIFRQETLATHNTKHFKFIKGLRLTKPY